MKKVRLKIGLFVMSMCLMEVSSLFNFQPAKFARERYERSRQRTLGRAISPITNEVIDFVGLVNEFGYPGENHLLTTIDGYKLHIHRIPGSPSRPKAKGKPIVLLQHGLFASSDWWVLMGPTNDLAYMLADTGYDVWLGNMRGNTYSRSHVELSPDYDPEFWQFSFHEIGMFDLSSMIDYILGLTNQRSLIYIGHSMGTTVSYVLLSVMPEYNEKISLVISLAPAAFWHEPLRPLIKFFKENTDAIKNFITNSRIFEIFPLTEANGRLAKLICADGSVFQRACVNFIYLTSGYNPSQLNKTIIPYVFSYFPAGASTQTLIHFGQNINTGDFRMYDYGIKNFVIYKQAKPPLYNISNIVTPVAILYGRGDALVSPENVVMLSRKLPNTVMVEAVPDKMFTHLDFVLSRDIKTLVNDRILKLITKYSKRDEKLSS